MPNSAPSTCALCLQPAELLESHIIPEFLYASMYDEKHRFQVLSREVGDGNRFLQKGLREKLCCAACEQVMAKHERYASQVLDGHVPIQTEIHGRLRALKGLDYLHLRMFQLAILWRSAASKQTFFSNVKLGPHEDRLRQLVLSDNPGHPRQYGCLVYALVHEGQAVRDLMVQPGAVRVNGVTGHRFVFGGYLWVFSVASHFREPNLDGGSLLPHGELLIMNKEIRDAAFIASFGRDLVAQGKV